MKDSDFPCNGPKGEVLGQKVEATTKKKEAPSGEDIGPSEERGPGFFRSNLTINQGSKKSYFGPS